MTQDAFRAAEAPRTAEYPPEPHPRTGLDAFEHAVEALVAAAPEKYAAALSESALKGNMASLKFMHEVLRNRNRLACDAEENYLPSLAGMWAAEPEWQGDQGEIA